jgi:hypothetical protein
MNVKLNCKTYEKRTQFIPFRGRPWLMASVQNETETWTESQATTSS